MKPSADRPPRSRHRLRAAALTLLARASDEAPLLCGCEEPGCPTCDYG